MGFKYDSKGINVITGFDLTAQAPLDSRTVVESVALLNTLPANRLYEGLTVFVIEDKKKYTYVQTGVDEETSLPVYGWEKDVDSGDTSKIIADLTAEDTRLQEAINTTNDSIKDLANTVKTNKEDVDKNITRIDGDETVEGSFRKLIKDTKDAHTQDVNALTGRIETLEGASENYSGRLTTLEGDSDTEGSVAKAVKDSAESVTSAYKAADTELSNTIKTNKEAIEASLATEVAARKELDTNIHTELSDQNTSIRKDFADADEALSKRITQNATDIEDVTNDITDIAKSLNETIIAVNTHTNTLATLNADSNTAGSVDYKIKQAVDGVDNLIDVAGSHKNIVESVTITEDGQSGIVFGTAVPTGYNVGEDAVKLIINGLVYAENSAFVVNRSGGVIRWTLDSTNGGFDIEADDVVEVDYSIRKALTVSYERVKVDLNNIQITPDGDYDSDPASYIEELDLSSYNIHDYYATIINGVTYSGTQAQFEAETGILAIAGVYTEPTDQVYIVMAVPVEE